MCPMTRFLCFCYNCYHHVFIDLTFEPGWDVDIKLRKGGNSAGTSDVVGFYGFYWHSLIYFDVFVSM